MASGADIVVDARGHRCPTPTLRLRRAIEQAPPGVVIMLLADDPLARLDVPHFAGQIGAEILSVADGESGMAFRVRKPAQSN